MAKSTLRVLVNGALVLILVAGTALVFWPFQRAANEMTSFCGGFSTGTTVAQVKARAAANGYEVAIEPGGKIRISDARLNSQHSCELAVGAAAAGS